MTVQGPGNGIRRRVEEDRCACCGLHTEDFEVIGAPEVRMCREYCITPPSRDHRDAATVAGILSELAAP